MDSFDKIEAMLAELLEQANDQKANSGKLSRKLDSIDGRLSNLEAVSASPQVLESIITLADHDKKMDEVEGQLQKWYGCYEKYKNLYEKLLAEKPYWATKEWSIKAFRWIHDKRHYWIWIIYFLFTLILSLSICNSVFQRRKIIELQDTQMKYRFIKAIGAAPKEVQFLEDAYEQQWVDRLNHIEGTVSDYEKVLKHKADSIARSEREKLERF